LRARSATRSLTPRPRSRFGFGSGIVAVRLAAGRETNHAVHPIRFERESDDQVQDVGGGLRRNRDAGAGRLRRLRRLRRLGAIQDAQDHRPLHAGQRPRHHLPPDGRADSKGRRPDHRR
jgi:hypothetical protein